MPVVAVAGGTGNLGRAIVDALQAHNTAEGKYDLEIVVLTRRPPSSETQKQLGAARVVVSNYADIDALASLLDAHAVHTLISTLDTLRAADAELALVKAADRAKSVHRYIPSIWGIKVTPRIAAYNPLTRGKLAVLEAVAATTTLETTVIYNGYLSDYYLNEHVPSYVVPWALAIDAVASKAALPGDGDTPVVFNHSVDVAKFTAALLSLPDWDRESYIVTDRLTLREVVSLIEEAKGERFDVVYDDIKDLEAGMITELPGHKALYAAFPKEVLQGVFAGFERMIIEGVFNLQPDVKTLNEVFPGVEPRTMQELVWAAWKA